jgi:hypothetical protein
MTSTSKPTMTGAQAVEIARGMFGAKDAVAFMAVARRRAAAGGKPDAAIMATAIALFGKKHAALYLRNAGFRG